MSRDNTLSAYIPPSVKTMEIHAQTIICQSVCTGSMYERDYGNGGFTE